MLKSLKTIWFNTRSGVLVQTSMWSKIFLFSHQPFAWKWHSSQPHRYTYFLFKIIIQNQQLDIIWHEMVFIWFITYWKTNGSKFYMCSLRKKDMIEISWEINLFAGLVHLENFIIGLLHTAMTSSFIHQMIRKNIQLYFSPIM